MEQPSNLPQPAGRSLVRMDAQPIVVPALVAAAGEEAARHFLNFFIASIRNRNTRRSYARHARLFLSWCEHYGIRDIRTEHDDALAKLRKVELTS